MRRTTWACAIVALGASVLLTADGIAADAKRKMPYFASIGAGKARMRTGPGRSYPASWLYVRPDLPVKVVDAFKEWRKVEDPGGTRGWMLAALVSDTRTAMIQGGVTALHRGPDAGTGLAWRAEPGVVGRVTQCVQGWCRFDVHGQAGFVEATRLWGVDAGETLP